MRELLDKFDRDRWVEILTEILEENQELLSEQDIVLEQVIEYLKGKAVKIDVQISK